MLHFFISLLVFVASGVLAAPMPDVTSLAVTATATTSVGPNPTQVYINAITYGGTGCPQGSVGSFLSADRQTFTLIFDSYIASLGTGIAITENRKNCQLNIDLQYPSGFQYSLFNAIYRGYVQLDKSVTGVQKTTYYFSGQTAQASTETDFSGPVNQDYTITDTIPFTSTIWSPCGTALPLNVNTQVRLTSTLTGSSGYMTTDTVDGHITFVVGLQWQVCKP